MSALLSPSGSQVWTNGLKVKHNPAGGRASHPAWYHSEFTVSHFNHILLSHQYTALDTFALTPAKVKKHWTTSTVSLWSSLETCLCWFLHFVEIYSWLVLFPHKSPASCKYSHFLVKAVRTWAGAASVRALLELLKAMQTVYTHQFKKKTPGDKPTSVLRRRMKQKHYLQCGFFSFLRCLWTLWWHMLRSTEKSLSSA